jgi:cytoskeletal protein RodZ
MLSANRVPINQAPIADKTTGLVSREWFRFFANLNTIVSSVYTPTLTNTTNIASSTASVCQYLQVYSTATVSGQVTIAATATGAAVLKMSLPMASSFSSTGQAAGTFATLTAGGTTTGAILADIVNDIFEFRFNAANTTSTVYAFTVTYQVV